MCGIAGIIAEDSIRFEAHLQKMVQSLHHRGPDATGFYHFNKGSLGHARLSIVDLGTGQQPMLNHTGSVGITFNGEIYGYQGIKREQSSYPYKTTSDTEVILALYQAYGEHFLKYLPGAFAFGLWDNQSETLYLARDRFGEKPLYYAFGPHNEFIFASEIKAILASGLIEPRLSNASVSNYLKRLYVHPTKTIYENIYSLPPAHTLILNGGNTRLVRYWDYPKINAKITASEAQEQFKYLLEQAVKKQLIADVPVAAFLSGGLDSSTIVSIASKVTSNLTTFSFGFGNSINELPLAKKSAKRYQTNHIELHANDYNLAELLVTMQKVYDEPFADSSNIPTCLISKLASQHAKVVLTGDGGDELLGGYNFWYNPLVSVAQLHKHQNLRTTLSLAHRILSKASKRGSNYLMRPWLPGIYNTSVKEAHKKQNIYFNENEIEQLGLKTLLIDNYFELPYESFTLNDAMNMDILDYMPGDILVKTDRASMANSLELRAPFLDVHLAEFCISLPPKYKLNSKTNKILLRNTFGSQWIDDIKTLPKQGFGAPVNQWLKQSNFVELKNEFLLDNKKRIFDLLDYKAVIPYLKMDNYNTWQLLVLSVWMETR